jgi:hypothetical protein
VGVIAKLLAAAMRWALAHPATVAAGISDGVQLIKDAKSGK